MTATCEADYIALCDASKYAKPEKVVLIFLQSRLVEMCTDIRNDETAMAIENNPTKKCVKE